MFEQDILLEKLGVSSTNKITERLFNFAYIPPAIIASIANQALPQKWGKDNYVLTKYLAASIIWGVEQNRYTVSDNQFYVTAGHLQTRYGTPIYLVFANNKKTEAEQPYYLVTAGTQISAPQLPIAPEIPSSPEIPKGAEIIMMHDHILEDNAERVNLASTPRIAQMCAISGAIQWSLNRNLQLPYWYWNRMSYLVPLYLQSREDITAAPDLVAPVQINRDSLLVRTVLQPYMPYANARIAVSRHDQLPHWLLDAWDEHSDQIPEELD